MTNQHADGSFDETGARRGAIENVRNGWHSDLAYDAVPAKATLLHATNVPSSGGNTCFASAAAAYEALPEETRERARGLECLFVYGTDQRNKSLAIAAQSLDKEQRATHPVINAHAVTGRAAIYANPMSTVGIVGMEQEDADRLLDEMFDMLDRPEFRWEHEWSVGDTLMWDNRGGTMHCGRLDYPLQRTAPLPAHHGHRQPDPAGMRPLPDKRTSGSKRRPGHCIAVSWRSSAAASTAR